MCFTAVKMDCTWQGGFRVRWCAPQVQSLPPLLPLWNWYAVYALKASVPFCTEEVNVRADHITSIQLSLTVIKCQGIIERVNLIFLGIREKSFKLTLALCFQLYKSAYRNYWVWLFPTVADCRHLPPHPGIIWNCFWFPSCQEMLLTSSSRGQDCC